MAQPRPQAGEQWLRKADGVRVQVVAVVAAKPHGEAVLYTIDGGETVSEGYSNFRRLHRKESMVDRGKCDTCPFKALAQTLVIGIQVRKPPAGQPQPGFPVCGQCAGWRDVPGKQCGWCNKRKLWRRREEPATDLGDDQADGPKCKEFKWL